MYRKLVVWIFINSILTINLLNNYEQENFYFVYSELVV